MLYPLNIITELDPSNLYMINQGSLIAFPFTVGSGQSYDIAITHTRPTQDYSLRAWVSGPDPGGEELIVSPQSVAFWNPRRNPNLIEVVTVHDIAVPPPGPMSIAVAPGNYHVNVLNLISMLNGFAFSLTLRE